MIIPEEILQKQLCSQCQKYLSVVPIRVYPNRQIKCGRCLEDDDLGVESSLYHAVVKDMMFPCVNRYDGCNMVLPMSKMRHHENDCIGGLYDCFLCSEFRGTAYDLNLHCQQHHQKETLENSEFLIDFHKIYQNQIFFHAKGIRLFFIHCNYDADDDKLSLDVIFIGKCFKGNMSYSLRLYSIEKELLYKKTKPSLCSIMELGLGTRSVVNLKSMKFARNLAICQVSIHEEPELALIENIPVIDPTFKTCILKCTFKNINEMNFEESVFFPAVYYLQDIEWKVFIKRKLSLTDYKRKFGIFLQCDEANNDNIETCKVSAMFSLLSSDFRRRLSKSFVKKEYSGKFDAHGFMLTDWNYVMDPASGFVDGNCINVEVKVHIYLDCKREVKCKDCNQSCFYCN